MRVTIRDVARLAGVGQATVSRVLNGNSATPETREKVLKAAAELGFVPNQAARSLVSKSSGAIGLIVPDITNPFFPAITRGVEDSASEGGHAVFLCNTDNDPAMEERDVRRLQEHRVDGIIFVGASDRHHTLELLQDRGIPVVVTDRHIEDLDVDSVIVDNLLGATSAVRHLVELGHRRIATVAGRGRTRTGQDRYSGYVAALQEAGIELDESLVVQGAYSLESGYRAAQVLLGRSPRPTAIFAANDLMAIGVMRAAEEAGLSVPDDLSVVGFDDIQTAELVRPALTTVRQPAYEMGRMAMAMLRERITGQEAGAGRRHVYRPELVVRGTTRRR